MRPDDWSEPLATQRDMVEQGSVDGLTDRAQRARRRIGTVLLTLTGVALVAILLSDPTARFAQPSPTGSPNPVPGYGVGGVAFTDARHGYVLLRPCRPTRQCSGTWSLLRTANSGRSWHRVDSPLDTRSTQFAEVFAHGQHNVGLVLDAGRFLSTNAGTTWRLVPAIRVAEPVVAAPADSEVGVVCPVRQSDCQAALAASDPVTGISHPLAHQPPLPDVASDSVLTSAGQVWLISSSPSGGTPVLLHSTDAGVHWQRADLPDYSAWFQPQLLAAPDQYEVYLTTRDSWRSRAVKVWRLVAPDGRWEPAATDGVPMDQIQDVRVLPNGELRYADIAGNAWLTRDGATQVAPAPQPVMDGRPINVNIAQVIDGVVLATPVVGLRADRILISTDSGRHWQVRPVPAG